MFAGLSRTSLAVLTGTLAALVLVTTVAPVARVFGFETLAPAPWLGALLCGVGMLLVFQLAKQALGRVGAGQLR
jgi:ABC-type spermidine/putrescine transport system permease subunit II